ncbi:MAG: alpha/beta hydrolase, partial [Chloroflexota bacterium]|nr:alpha/beta hydrolase [Chloroflexota bacterium]
RKLPCVRVPTLVVRGGRDPIVPQAWAEEVARLLPRGRLVVIPGAAHAVNHDAPAALARVVLPFLTERHRNIPEQAPHPLDLRTTSVASTGDVETLEDDEAS